MNKNLLKLAHEKLCEAETLLLKAGSVCADDLRDVRAEVDCQISECA